MPIDIEKAFGIAFALSVVVEITPIKINPWSWVGKQIGSLLCSSIIARLDNVEKDIKDLREVTEKQNKETQEKIDEQNASRARQHILAFGDEVRLGKKHSKENFEQTLRDIDLYDRYCASHPDYLNNVTKVTSKRILDVYEVLLETNGFLD